MRIIISPAKKMNEKQDYVKTLSTPALLPKAKKLGSHLQSLNYEDLKELLSCNDTIARLNYDRYQSLSIESAGVAAILSYEGLAFRHMAPNVFDDAQWEYVNSNLCILSGLYGILKPMDSIRPYRLEMQAKLKTDFCNDLYDYWGDSIYRELVKDNNNVIVNLASKEYSKVIEPYLEEHIDYITCVFGTLVDNKVKVKGTLAKMARGEMVRFMARENVSDLEGIKAFHELGFSYDDTLSTKNEYVFIKDN